MSDNTVLGSLPNRRPARRSTRRAPNPAVGTPTTACSEAPPGASPEPFSDALQAVVELATLGISVSAKALRASVSRLPRP